MYATSTGQFTECTETLLIIKQQISGRTLYCVIINALSELSREDAIETNHIGTECEGTLQSSALSGTVRAVVYVTRCTFS